ncbi:MAG: hypothetical protein GXZ11_07775 [Tissierellia bacterium]|nr:hypothetical protein [Tissierellia bacterium]
MKTFEQNYILSPWNLSERAYISIATTGLSPVKEHIFCTGLLLVKSDGSAHLSLYLSERLLDEKEVLLCIFAKTTDKSRIIGYNVNHFLFPWIDSRSKYFHINDNAPKVIIDMQSQLKNLSCWVPMDSISLKSVSKIAGYFRESVTLPQDLPGIFSDYIIDGQPEYRDALFMHMRDDLLAMASIDRWLQNRYLNLSIIHKERTYKPLSVKIQGDMIVFSGLVNPSNDSYINMGLTVYEEHDGKFTLEVAINSDVYDKDRICRFVLKPWKPDESCSYDAPKGVYLLTVGKHLISNHLWNLLNNIITEIL